MSRRGERREARRPKYGPKEHYVWQVRGALGFRRSVDGAASVAAPLLAGFSFTLLVLLLPNLTDKTTTIRASGGTSVVTESQAFSAAPEVAAILLLLAGLLLVASVQAALAMRYHGHTPSDFQEWYPHFFRDGGENGDEPDGVRSQKGWVYEDAEPIAVGTKWYAAWPRKKLFTELLIANFWARWARRLYHAGIVALLSGLAVLVYPPIDERDTERWILFGVAAGGAAAEAIWIFSVSGDKPQQVPPAATAEAQPRPAPAAEPAAPEA